MRRRSDLRIATLDEVVKYGSRGGHRALRARGLLPPIMGAAGFTLDQATLGTTIASTASTATYTYTTSAAAAAGSFIVLTSGWFENNSTTGTMSVSGGGLTWNVAVSVGTTGAVDGACIAWAQAPAGLASGTVLTLGAGLTGNGMSGAVTTAASFFGAAATSPADGTSSKAFATITSGNWSGNTIAGMTGTSDLVVACGWGDGQAGAGATTLSANGAGWTAGATGSQSGSAGGVITLLYAMNVAAVPNPTNWGTWATNVPTGALVLAAAFQSAGAAASPLAQSHLPWMAPQGM